MISHTKAVLLMSLLFSRASRLHGFQLLQRHWGKVGHHPIIKRRANPPCCLFYKRKFSSSDMSAPQIEGEDSSFARAVSPELESCVIRFVNDGSLSQEESDSVVNSLFYNHFGRSLIAKKETEEIKAILQTSIDSYLIQKTKRAEAGRDAIANPGSYIRSILKKQIEESEAAAAPVAPVKNTDASYSNDDTVRSSVQVTTEAASNREDTVGVHEIRELLQLNNVEPNELNESCLRALSQHDESTIRYALETYSKQKKRREENGIDRIANPSSYVMAVLRNSADKRSPNLSTSDQPNSNKLDTYHESPKVTVEKSTQTDDNDLHSPPSILSEMPSDHKPQPLETGESYKPPPFDTGESYKPPLPAVIDTEQNPDNGLDCITKKAHQLNLDAFDEVLLEEESDLLHMNKTPDEKSNRVSMEYVDKCLALLAKLEKPVKTLPGIGPKTQKALNKLGLFTLRDLLWYFPRSFIDRSVVQSDITTVPDGELGTFILNVHKEKAKHNSVPCTDEKGNSVDIVFMYGMSKQGATIVNAEKSKLCGSSDGKMIVSGKIKSSERGYAIFNPDVIVSVNNASEVLGIEPVYRLNSGLSQNKLVKAIDGALEVAEELHMLPESLPSNVLEDIGWPTFVDAIRTAHKPKNMDEAGIDSPARNRLAFEELCMQQAQLALARWDMKYSGFVTTDDSESKNAAFTSWQKSPLIFDAMQALPFELTESQLNCLDEIWSDAIVSENGRMIRLLQGDVGSGKTVLAYLAGLGCIESRQGGGSVVAMLAPTQLLANQHFQTISDFANALNNQLTHSTIKNIRVELLTGSIVGSKRDDILSRLENAKESEAFFLIGTHVLITSDIVERLHNLSSNQSKGNGLALSIVDEEQRFGVRQRQALSGCAANTLFMSATPIPRTFGLSRSGLFDVTCLESKPRNVQTTITTSDNLDKLLGILQTKISNGSKCFWVLPRIGETETSDEDSDSSSHQSSVLSRYAMLKDVLGHEKVGHVHGKMSIKDREEQLAKFSDAKGYSVLVSTTVIEVGIDIKNVDILIVENAERFGLSALHQLRGRIGRKGSNDINSHCILLSEEEYFNATAGPSTSLQRLDILRETMSGQQIAEADFYLRGPGDLMGNTQSGLFRGKAVNPDHHWGMIEAATIIGRAFSPDVILDKSKTSMSKSDCVLMKRLQSGELQSFYDQTDASSEKGFGLRIMMALFADWNSQTEDNKSGILHSITTLQRQSEAKNLVSTDDELTQQKIVSFLQTLSARHELEKSSVLENANANTAKARTDECETKTSNTVANNVPLERMSPLSVLSERVDMTRDVVFICLDVETTGLSDKSDHVIQIAAKLLGSKDEADLFSEYILPPIEKIPENIEQLTGITDSFLRFGGYDEALGAERDGPARAFSDVFLDFQSFCTDKAQEKPIVLLAHNARFDMGMLNGELKRLRCAAADDNVTQSSLPSSLSDVFDSSVDTLRLFRDRRWWTGFSKPVALARPDSFKLGHVYEHVFGEPIVNSHNAVGDILALERLLMEKNVFHNWEHVANEIQIPFSKLNKHK